MVLRTKETTKLPEPYLSIVVTSRNDNHGGDMLKRMQIFLNTLLKQCKKYQFPAELIIVEWNPPTDSPTLEHCLDFKEKNKYCPVRIITVPGKYHQRLSYSDRLPLFQMIAKNVGIRRAKGEFVLATNIDVIFSTQLIKYFGSRSLSYKKMYRIDRTDVKNDLPGNGNLREIQKYCNKNIIRICTRTGIITSDIKSNLVFRSFTMSHWPNFFIPLDQIYRNTIPWLPTKSHWKSLLKLETYSWKNFIIVCKHLHRSSARISEITIKNIKAFGGNLADISRSFFSLWNKTSRPRKQKKKLRLHTNACGDFTLLAKQDWLDLQGNPEWEMFSFHLDSVFCYLADANGLEECVIKPSARLFHIEHGSGFTPEQGEQMYARIRSMGIPILTSGDLRKHQETIYKNKKFTPENPANWGLIDHHLPERIIF